MVKKFIVFAKQKVIGEVSMLNRVLEVNFFFSNILIPLIVLIFYFVSIEFLLVPFFDIQNGINNVFVRRSWRFFSLLALGSSLIFFAIIKFKPSGKLKFKKSTDKITSGDLILLLLPLTPVVQYVINNQDILSPISLLSALIFFVLFSGIYIFIIPAVLGFIGSTRTLISLGLAFVFTITSMALLSSSFTWHEKGSLKIQLMFFGCTFLVTWLLYRLSDKKVLRVLIVVVFISYSIGQLFAREDLIDRTSHPVAENKLLSLVEEMKPVVTPNIYLLIYDSYVTNETMLAYGIDNSSQEDYLEELSFELYPHTYSVANYSIGTMSKVLNASREFGDPRRVVSGDGIIHNTLRGFGYETYGLFSNDLFFRKNNPTYDFSIPEPNTTSHDILIRAILLGEFRFDIGFNSQPREQFVETKRNIFESISGGPRFIYMHSSLPGHSQNSGACLSDETDRFKKRLTSANLEMQEDIKRIIDNDPGAIIIVAGDHGPYLTKNCASLNEYEESEISRLDIQDRFGTFLAIRWPTQDFEKFDDIVVLQDLFPAVFAYIFNDERFLESKIESTTFSPVVKVRNGIIYKGINRSEPLFVTDK
jgi:hypothetical protein